MENAEELAVNLEQAKKMVRAERRARVEACRREIQAVLAKYQLRMAAVPRITADGHFEPLGS